MDNACWACGAFTLVPFRSGVKLTSVNSHDFNITSSKYGVTGEIFRCQTCGFMQCSDFIDTLPYYQDLIDPAYESSRVPRSKQAMKIMASVQKYKPSGRLLDIGAGSGILVEQARNSGYIAEGIEPSSWLQTKAQLLGLTVHLGSFPHPKVTGLYDVIGMVDVLEHIPMPFEIIKEIPNYLKEDGIVVVITPDVSSLMARLMGPKWWHFRIAHVGYYDVSTLNILFRRAGLRHIKTTYASWYFSLDYLLARVNHYLPHMFRLPIPSFCGDVVIPLNLADSIMSFYGLESHSMTR